ncbi:MAG: endonuclease/exonuclease/phosphatase family protein, partial [Planctomycetaceae bacterium]|nr:endonuclease/exonuclease/phosphatase family protein [Planctomycetaceae bacterium]
MNLNQTQRGENRVIGFLRDLVALLQFLAACALLLTFVARHWWLADLLANLRIQIIAGCALLLLMACMTFDRRSLFPGIFLLLFAGWPLAGHMISHRLGDGSVSSNVDVPSISICTINVLSGNRRMDDIATAMVEHQPDVIAVLEVTSGHIHDLRTRFQTVYPYQWFRADDRGNFGIGLLSRIPFRTVQEVVFNDSRIPSVEAELQFSEAQLLTLIATHTLPPMGPTAFAHRNQHLAMLAEHVVDTASRNPIVVVGDLNLTPWSPVYDDWLQNSGLNSALAGPYAFPTHTWYRFPSMLFGLCLDHCCATPDVQCSERHVSGDFGSDHRAVT